MEKSFFIMEKVWITLLWYTITVVHSMDACFCRSEQMNETDKR